MTHFAPPDREAALVHTTRPLYLPHEEFERYLGCPCPIGQLQLAFLPADAQVQEVQVGAGIILVSMAPAAGVGCAFRCVEGFVYTFGQGWGEGG